MQIWQKRRRFDKKNDYKNILYVWKHRMNYHYHIITVQFYSFWHRSKELHSGQGFTGRQSSLHSSLHLPKLMRTTTWKVNTNDLNIEANKYKKWNMTTLIAHCLFSYNTEYFCLRRQSIDMYINKCKYKYHIFICRT